MVPWPHVSHPCQTLPVAFLHLEDTHNDLHALEVASTFIGTTFVVPTPLLKGCCACAHFLKLSRSWQRTFTLHTSFRPWCFLLCALVQELSLPQAFITRASGQW